jgi:hypothetical protein
MRGCAFKGDGTPPPPPPPPLAPPPAADDDERNGEDSGEAPDPCLCAVPVPVPELVPEPVTGPALVVIVIPVPEELVANFFPLVSAAAAAADDDDDDKDAAGPCDFPSTDALRASTTHENKRE